ncbi:MAG: TIGR02221 family CRISPR-associated protein [Mojavia pulchra JT2-VF2]|jgi:CRISPR-associated DxTHG motif protein|uniref:TIGR02221 family CRISPR-associated protein n=1 Tax=Mojavia pulchra JT2-VF2 TaxID=287848 RepID=A0A951Q575_9NOST|nr:TIGR02221 family CRISPR-associated protein [Mojavia pulchra JT2-VF2]
MRKIITFLGIQAKKTTYSFEGVNYNGEVFAEALHQFCTYDSMLVCVTSEAKKKTFSILEKLEDERIEAIDIPNGETTEEMWETFKAITDRVNENDNVIFDITHGLRSLPFLVFLFAAYLKAAKDVTIEAIYYGAWELGFSNNGIAPVINLSEFVSMLDWITATDQFTQTGDAQRLAKLLNPDGKASNITKKAATTLSEVSLATLLCQPLQLATKAQSLESDLLKAQEQLQLTAPPFEMLRQRITDTFGNFISDFQKDAKKALESQFRLIIWYQNNNRLIEAMTLAREWLINAVTYRLGLPFTLKISTREKLIARAISGLEMVSRDDLTVEELNEYGRIIYDTWTEKDNLIQLWNVLQPVRNGLDHAGHQDGAMSISKIVKTANEKVKPLLINLAITWELENCY